MARLRSDIYVSALLRQVSLAGGTGVVAAKGFDEAGAVFIEWYRRGEGGLLLPAPQSFSVDMEVAEERSFIVADEADEPSIAARMEKERSFDPDCWHVAIENVDPREWVQVAAA